MKCHSVALYLYYYMLTGVAGGSSVAAVGAVTVEGAPRLSTSTSVFTVTWGTSERQTEKKYKQEREKLTISKSSLKVSQGCP